jgi:hypothetical protein
VSVMEKNPTDRRIDDLALRGDRFEADVKDRFDKVDRDFVKVDGRFERFEDKVDVRFDKVEARLGEMATKDQLAEINARFDKWGKIVTSGVVTIVAAVILKLMGI